jgi:hypothetical protein
MSCSTAARRKPKTNPQAVLQEPAKIDKQKLSAEIDELTRYIQWAQGIGVDTKTRAILKALEIGFGKMREAGPAQRAVVFTESRRTQQFLRDFLEANGYAGRVIPFNGTNSNPESTRIYEQWLEASKDNGRPSGSRAIDVRAALIEHFENHGDIFLATEAGAEGKQVLQGRQDILGLDAACHLDRQTLPRVLIQDHQELEPPAVGGLVRHKVITPHVVDVLGLSSQAPILRIAQPNGPGRSRSLAISAVRVASWPARST